MTPKYLGIVTSWSGLRYGGESTNTSLENGCKEQSQIQ